VLKVMVVDDDYLVRQGFIRIMPWSEYDMEVIGEAGSGMDALALLERQPVDLLITDLAMPAMSGIDLMKQVKERYPRIAMVVLTFHHDFELIRDALRLGALDYITKIELEQDQMSSILERIRQRIEELSPRAEASAPSKEAILKLGRELSALAWMSDEVLFNQLIADVAELQLPAVQFEQMIYLAVQEWNKYFDSPLFRIEENGKPNTWQGWASWLREVRACIRDDRVKQVYSHEVATSILRAADYIKQDLRSEIQLPAMAEKVHMSRSYFSKCFRDIMGKTFQDYVRDLKIEHAKTLLRQTNKSIGWVAAESGYPNEKYFSKVFRETTGELPRDYRKAAAKVTDRPR